jgi:copper transport protein
MKRIKPIAASLCAITLLLVFSSIAFAHAQPVKYDPQPGSHLGKAPDSIQVWFDQPIEPALSRFQVLDRAKNRIDVPDELMLSENGQHATVPLLSGIKPGVYTVIWRVVSAQDGHLTKGTYAFVVEGAAAPTPAGGGTAPTLVPGQPSPTPEPTIDISATATISTDTGQQDTSPSPLDIASRWLSFALAALLIGGAAFVGLVSRPAADSLPADERSAVSARFTHAFIIFGIILGLLLVLSEGLELLAETARVNEADLGTVLGNLPTVGAVLGSTFGLFLKLRLACVLAIPAVLLVVLAFGGRAEGRAWPLVIVFGGAYYLAEAMSGHEASVASASGAGLLARLAPYSDWLHLMSTAVWIGGLGFFVIILLPRLRGLSADSRRLYLTAAVHRFSPIALACVVLLVGSGSVSMLAHDTTLDDLLNTDWGHALLFKFALLALLIGMGALNMFVTRPRLKALRQNDAAAVEKMSRSFRWLMNGEVTLVAAVLVFSAILTLSAPASTGANSAAIAALPTTVAIAPAGATPTRNPAPPTATPGLIATATPQAPVALTETVRGVNVQLSALPGADADQFRIHLSDAKGQPYANVTQVSMRLTLLDVNGSPGGTDTLLADDKGSGNYAIPDAPYLTLAGAYQAVVVARVKNQGDDVKAAFRLTLADNGMLTGKLDEYLNAAIITDPSPPVSGDVNVTIKLTDANGKPVNNAKLTVQAIMPAHGHLADPLVPLNNGNGEYSGSVFLLMAGAWSIDITVQRPGKDTTVTEASFDVGRSYLDLTPYPSPQFTPAP